MDDCISRQSTLKLLSANRNQFPSDVGIDYGFAITETIIKSVPAEDVVKVIRCKDCLYYKPLAKGLGHMVCTYDPGSVPIRHAYDFCSKGKSKYKQETETPDKGESQ